jgi:hypothetical protein
MDLWGLEKYIMENIYNIIINSTSLLH